MSSSSIITSKTPGGGFSVFYHNRYLYSRYAPQRVALETASRLDIRENTLILGFSPVLCYGLRELVEKLPSGCFILLIELDSGLYDFFLKTYQQDFAAEPAIGCLSPGEIPGLAGFLERPGAADILGKPLPPPGIFKHCVRFDFSAGTELNPQAYAAIHQSADNAISRFWKNRLTLMRFGRIFSRNLFKNLPLLSEAEPLPVRQIAKPILVIGAGPSTDAFFSGSRFNFSQFYLIAVDTALPALLGRGAAPDVTVQVECQRAVEQAYYAAGHKHIRLALDLVSLPKTAEKFAASYYCFFTEFAQGRFIRRLKEQGLLPSALPPMGSVGLSAVYLALLFRKNQTVPVYVCGLDFSFTPGKTHCRGTPAHTRALLEAGRLLPPGEPGAAFKPGAFRTTGKNGASIYSDPALAGYRQGFTTLFSRIPALYDLGEQGLPLGLPRRSLPDLFGLSDFGGFGDANPNHLAEAVKKGGDRKNIRRYLAEEEAALEELRRILTSQDGGTDNGRLRELLKEREYLYLHFPEGYQVPGLLAAGAALDASVLKRIRAEIDGFLKVITQSMEA